MSAPMAKDAPPQQPRQISIEDLPVQELNRLKEQLQHECRSLADNLQNLKMFYGQFSEGRRSLTMINESTEGKKLMVPMTGSLYVPGTLRDTQNVLVDVGTGYYAKKSIPDADAFFDRKINFLREKMTGLTNILKEKESQLQAVMHVMQRKMQMQQQAAK
eukprot:gnl/Trimastix_PCT/831.p1 GENE.gnl/Trimastix_PCT/831~~gnl/Trimastix_PCT/831.p1  ORF type:complete len:160 (+),score=49.06 gnl/Trimastix_PCT/831:32-511(+)